MYIKPSAGLLVPCTRSPWVEETKVRHIYTNRDWAVADYDSCAARMQKLIDWYKEPSLVPNP